MWAMMPIFRILSSGVVRGIAFLYSAKTRGDQDAPLVCRGPVSLRRHREAFGPLDAGSLRSGSRDCLFRRLPPVMRESPVGLPHRVRFVFFLNSLALPFRGENQLGGQPLRHRLLFAHAAID